MSTLYVDAITEKTSSNGVHIAGHVVQFKTVSAATTVIVSSSTYTSLTGLSMTFAPKFSTSSLYILYSSHIMLTQDAGAWRGAEIKVFKDGTAISGGGTYGQAQNNNATNDRSMHYVYKDTVYAPNSTASATYEIKGSAVQSTVGHYFNPTSWGSGGRLTIMEIAQ
tara:strand:+ start:618 stop:1115 length:498 start_codon:yes stop_codon:yes gene_type:complete